MKKIGEFIAAFFAVDNTVNEQSVVGVFWGTIALVLVVLSVIGLGEVTLDLILTTLGASLLAFGIAGFKRF